MESKTDQYIGSYWRSIAPHVAIIAIADDEAFRVLLNSKSGIRRDAAKGRRSGRRSRRSMHFVAAGSISTSRSSCVPLPVS